MPTVKVKGVANPLSFPDDMDITDIKEVLRNKFTADMMKAPSLNNIPNVATTYEPSLSEKMSQGIANYLLEKGFISDNYRAQEIGKNLSMIAEFLPGIGDATAGDDFGRAVAQDDKLGMGLAALGVIPVAGDKAKQVLRKVKSVDLPSGKLGLEQFKLIKQSDPKAITKSNPDGTVNVTYKEEYQPKQLKGSLYEFDPDALELSEGTFKNVDSYRGNKNEPITVTKQDGDYVILDGHHRAKLAKQEGRNVNAVVIPIDDVAKMKKDNIHQADMRKEWVARGLHDKSQSLPIEEVKPITSYNEMFDFTPEQLAQQLRSTKPENVVNGVYIEKTKFGEKRFNPDGSIEVVKDGKVLRKFEPQDADMAYKNKIMKNIEERPDVKAAQEKRKADFDAERERLKRQEQDSYKMQHTAPTREGNSSGFDLTDTFGEDIYSARAKQYYGTGSTYDDKAISIIQSMRGNPDKEVTIYRAVPKSVSDINPSDWVTTTKEYAQDHMAGEKGWHILSKKVKAKDIATDGNSIHEFGYDPE